LQKASRAKQLRKHKKESLTQATQKKGIKRDANGAGLTYRLTL